VVGGKKIALALAALVKDWPVEAVRGSLVVGDGS